ncbi:calcium-binding protein [Altererythrobacter sp. GH1-8]|uniref:calcium-binding protein n=1 Tax=Altererythrobacter sp. GH1-8 TaxID=3349333 RepID=UPI00374CE376
MSIIPSPGPRPRVTPRTEEILISGEFASYIFGAGEIFYATDLPTAIRLQLGGVIENNGVVWLETTRPQVFFIVGSQPDIYNNGLIYLHGQSQVALNNGADRLVNTGDIFVISTSGWARVVQATSALVENSGIIAAQTLNSTPFSNSGNATAIDSYNGAIINNMVGGQILAEAPDVAIAIQLGGRDLDTGDPAVTNRGLIEAAATTANGISFGIYSFSAATSIVNYGTIRAEIAVYNVGDIVNETGGVIDGLIIQEETRDTIENNGLIIGEVYMGDGNDYFFGSGEVDGFVDMGWQDDTFEGSAFANIATGNRGNDTLSGFGGNDLLLGGFGHDLITGGTGNDGLFGEFGDDTIITQGGDYVEGGTGNDRVELTDYTFESVSGGSGFDVLVMAAGARNFSLAQMVSGTRISGFEAIELRGNQQLVLDATSIGKLTGGLQQFWVDATATDTVRLSGSWTRGSNITFEGIVYEVWRQGSTEVFVTEVATVTPNSSPSYGGFDAIAGGDAALRPGAAAGLDYTPQETFVSEYVINNPDTESSEFYEFVVTDEDIFFTIGEGFVFRGSETLNAFTNNGEIYALNDETHFANGLSLLQQIGYIDFTNNGLVSVQSTGPVAGIHDLIVVSVGVAVEGDLVNRGTIEIFSQSGNVLGAWVTTRARTFENSGEVIAISGSHAADGVNADATDVFGERSFFNTGLIYAEGVNVSDPSIYDPITTHPVAGAVAVGVRGGGNLTNDGFIIAAVGENAVEGARSVGVANFARSSTGNTITNNGEISGTISVFFYGTSSGDGHELINNALLVGDVHFGGGVLFSNPGDDIYDNRNGETRGTVFGFGGDDQFFTGAFDDSLDGGEGSDVAIFAGNFAEFLVREQLGGEFTVTGAGTDSLTDIEVLRFNDVDVLLDLGTGLEIDPGAANPDSFMVNIRDYDGNDLGGAASWDYIGTGDANSDGSMDFIFVNREIGRFATVGVGEDGVVQFGDHGQSGDTRVVGIYIDPLVASGDVEAGGPFDSQRRFQNDLFIGNIAQVLGSDDYDDDGIQEIYFALTDGTAYLRAFMHADGNIRYANYQSEQQMIDYLTANGYNESTYGSWLYGSGAQEDPASSGKASSLLDPVADPESSDKQDAGSGSSSGSGIGGGSTAPMPDAWMGSSAEPAFGDTLFMQQSFFEQHAQLTEYFG